ncbi:hypothetical protein HPP05_41320 [Corallococcus exiguus]|uniref:hypothetical protein n=1 Tax=Corallococcus TaxID=83461 RepID=UPI0011C3D731|nr:MULTISPECIES: hypothetical protein [Corallococcus]NPC76185.1 hypothetical protein [Corallococcus exiguus]
MRRSLTPNSTLHDLVCDGIKAVENKHHQHFDPSIRSEFDDSIDLDKAMLSGREGENRWDYLLGHEPSGEVIAVEPHSAKEDEISTIIKKRSAAMEQLSTHMQNGVRIKTWLWVASSEVYFADTERARRRLDQNGIEFVGKKVMAKHLPKSAPAKKQEHRRIKTSKK